MKTTGMLALTFIMLALTPASGQAASTQAIDREVSAALARLYAIAFDQLGRLTEASMGGQKFSRLRPGG